MYQPGAISERVSGSHRQSRSLVQVSAAPPAINPVVPAKILVASQHRLAELGQRQSGLLVSLEAAWIVMHVQGKRTFIQPSDRWSLALREPIEQSSDFPVVENAALVALLVPRKDVKGLHVARRKLTPGSALASRQDRW